MKTIVTPLSALLLLMAGTPASAQDHCFANGPTQLRVDLPPGSDSSLRVIAGGEVVLDLGETEDACQGASRDATTNVTVTVGGQEADETFVINHDGPGGPFKQHFNVDLGQGDDTLGIAGTTGNDRVLARTEEVAAGQFETFMEMQMYNEQLKREEASELNIEQVGDFVVLLLGGLDLFGVAGIKSEPPPQRSSAGSAAGPVAFPVIVAGGPGNDRLTGGVANDSLVGGSGNDRLAGGKGKDLMVGGKGKDRCKGGPGKDREKGCE